MPPQEKGYTLRPLSGPSQGGYSLRKLEPELSEEERLKQEYEAKLAEIKERANQPKPFNPMPTPLEYYTRSRRTLGPDDVYSDMPKSSVGGGAQVGEGEHEFSWTEQALRTVPAVGGSLIGGALGLPAALPTLGGSTVGGAMAGGAIGSGVGTFLGNWYAGRKTTPKELLVESAVGAIPPIIKPAKYAGQGASAILKYGAKTAGRSALEGAAVSGAATPFQHWAQTGSFDAPIENYGKNIGAGALMGGALGGTVGTLHGRSLNRQAIANVPPPPAPITNPARLLGAPEVVKPPAVPQDVPLNFGRDPLPKIGRPEATVPTPVEAKTRAFAKIDAEVANKVHELELQQSIAKREGDWGKVAQLDIEILTTKTDASALKRNYDSAPPEFKAMPENQGGLDFGAGEFGGGELRPTPFDFTPRGRRPGVFEASPGTYETGASRTLPPDRGMPPGTEVPVPERPLGATIPPASELPGRKPGTTFRNLAGKFVGEKNVVGDAWPLPEGVQARAATPEGTRQLDRTPDEARGRERGAVELEVLREKVARQPDSPTKTSTLERLDKQISEKKAAEVAQELKNQSEKASILQNITAAERIKISARYPHIAAKNIDDAVMRGINDVERARILERAAKATEAAERKTTAQAETDTSTPEGRVKAAREAAELEELRVAEEAAGIKPKGTSTGMFNLQDFYEKLRETQYGKKLAEKLSKARFHIIDVESGRPIAGRKTLEEARVYAKGINENIGAGAARYQVMDNETGTPHVTPDIKPFITPAERAVRFKEKLAERKVRADEKKAALAEEYPVEPRSMVDKPSVPTPPSVRAEVPAPKGRGYLPSPDSFDDVTVRNWAEQVAQLDKAGAGDFAYRQILSTGAKDALKKGETWRGRVVRYIDQKENAYRELNKTPEVVFKPKQGVKPPKPTLVALRNRLEDVIKETANDATSPRMRELLLDEAKALRKQIKIAESEGGTFLGSGVGALQEFYEKLKNSDKGKALLKELKESAFHLYNEDGLPIKGFATKEAAEAKALIWNKAKARSLKLGANEEIPDYFTVRANKKGVAGAEPPKPVVEEVAERPAPVSSAKKPEDIAPEDRFDPSSLFSTLKGMDKKARKIVGRVAEQFEYKDRPVKGQVEVERPAPINMDTPIGKLMQRLRDNTRLAAIRDFDVKAWREQKAAKLRGIEETGEAGHLKRMAALQGEAPKLKFKPLDMPQYVLDELIDASDRLYSKDQFKRIRAAEAIRALDRGEYITESRRALLANLLPEPALRKEMMNLYSNLPWEHIGELAEPVKGLVHNIAANAFKWTYGSTTTLKAAFDASFVGIQARGALHTKAFRRAFVPALKAFKSQDAFDAQQWERINSPYYDMLTEDMKVHFGGLENGRVLEQFTGGNKALENHWTVKPFHRAAIAFLNHIRFENGKLFAKLAEKRGLDLTNPEVAESIGRVVNEMTGHGSLSKKLGMPQASELLSHGLWSPRLTASRINMLKLFDYREYTKANRFAQKQRAMSAVSVLGSSLAAMKLLELAGGEGNYDPTSSKFGKVELNGQLIDTTGGFGSLATLVARIVSGNVTDFKGKTHKIYEGEFGKDSATELIGSYLENKMNPKLSYITKLINQTNPYTGKPYNIPAETLGLVLPLFVENVYDSVRNVTEGDGQLQDLFMLIPGFAGMNMYDTNRKRASLPEFLLSPVVKPKPKYTLRKNIERAVEPFLRDVVR
jgi:hypothetical protein